MRTPTSCPDCLPIPSFLSVLCFRLVGIWPEFAWTVGNWFDHQQRLQKRHQQFWCIKGWLITRVFWAGHSWSDIPSDLYPTQWILNTACKKLWCKSLQSSRNRTEFRSTSLVKNSSLICLIATLIKRLLSSKVIYCQNTLRLQNDTKIIALWN